MAYVLRCDNEACGSEIETGPGQPALASRDKLYCKECLAYVAQVEAQLKAEMTQFAQEGIARLATRRQELMAKMLPVSRGGSGEGHSEWPTV